MSILKNIFLKEKQYGIVENKQNVWYNKKRI